MAQKISKTEPDKVVEQAQSESSETKINWKAPTEKSVKKREKKSDDKEIKNQPTTQEENISDFSIGDQPTAQDFLGFKPYVRAIAEFLKNDKTKGPLTMSVEGEWGTGKSSFMLQLAEKLRPQDENTISFWEWLRKKPKSQNENKLLFKEWRTERLEYYKKKFVSRDDNEPYIIEFNAWRYDKEDEMWAAFALKFIEGLEKETPWKKRIWARLKLLKYRYNWRKGWLKFLLFVISLLFSAVFIYALIKTGNIDELRKLIDLSKPGTSPNVLVGILGGTLATIFTVGWAIVKLKDLFINPLTVDLKRHLEKPDYEGRSSFIEDFHTDFKNIIAAYAGEEKSIGDEEENTNKTRKIFVFIDDLDRCDIPKSADLMQALNMMISNSSPQLFFILGIDREKVAAGLAVKYEKLLPYIAATSGAPQNNQSNNNRVGIEYGYSFVEKFIQIPFKVPQPSGKNIERLIDLLNGEKPENLISKGDDSPPKDDFIKVKLEEDSDSVKDVVKMVASTFDYNPRRIKQFLNLFRLKAYIGHETGLFSVPDKPEYKPLTFEKLGKFVALTLRYPLLIEDLKDQPQLLSDLQYIAWGNDVKLFEKDISSSKFAVLERWSHKTKIINLLKEDFKDTAMIKAKNELQQPDKKHPQRQKFSMTEMNISKLLEVSAAKKRVEQTENDENQTPKKFADTEW